MHTLYLEFFLLLLIFIFVLLVFLFLITLRRKKLLVEFQKQNDFSPGNVLCRDDTANFFGIKSLGYKQFRGNGLLLLTKDNLYFNRFFPEKEIIIPITSIVSVDTPKSFLGKTIFRELLQVNFINENGKQDSAAWYVKDFRMFKEKLEELISK